MMGEPLLELMFNVTVALVEEVASAVPIEGTSGTAGRVTITLDAAD